MGKGGTVREPWKRGRLEFEDIKPIADNLEPNPLTDASAPDFSIRFIEEAFGLVCLFEDYQEGEVYVIGSDVGQGRGAAYSTGHVLKHVGNGVWEEVAFLRSNTIRENEWAVELFKLGYYFGTCLVGVERTGAGLATAETLVTGNAQYPQTKEGYPDLYYHRVNEIFKIEPTKDPGWETQTKSKARMLSDLGTAVDEDTIIIHSKPTLLEMQSYARDDDAEADDEKYKPQYIDPVTKKKHDDCIMGVSIAYQMGKFVQQNDNYWDEVQEAS